MYRVGHGAPASAICSRSDDGRVAGVEEQSGCSRFNPSGALCSGIDAPQGGLNDRKQGTKRFRKEVLGADHQKRTCFNRELTTGSTSIYSLEFEEIVDGR